MWEISLIGKIRILIHSRRDQLISFLVVLWFSSINRSANCEVTKLAGSVEIRGRGCVSYFICYTLSYKLRLARQLVFAFLFHLTPRPPPLLLLLLRGIVAGKSWDERSVREERWTCFSRNNANHPLPYFTTLIKLKSSIKSKQCRYF